MVGAVRVGVVVVLLVLGGCLGLGNGPPGVDSTPGTLEGSGTVDDPFEVGSLEELRRVGDDPTAHYVLVDDVDASATAGTDFEPIGARTEPGFTGSLDGNGHAITGLEIDRPDDDEVGLFATVDGGTVEDVTLVNASVIGADRVGGLAGHVDGGTVEDVTLVDVSVTGDDHVGGLVGHGSSTPATYENVAVTDATVTGDDRIGGLAGTMEDDAVTDASVARSTVTSTDAHAGGLVGEARNTAVSRSVVVDATVDGGTAVGGLLGTAARVTVSDSYTRGVSVGGPDAVGGVFGAGGGGPNTVERVYVAGPVEGDGDPVAGSVTDVDTVFEHCYWDVEATGHGRGIAGSDHGTDSLTGAEAVDTMSGLDFDDVWTVTDGYPVLDREVVDLQVSVPAVSITTDESVQPSAEYTLRHGATVPVTELATFETSDETVAVVTDGALSPVDPGETSLSATVDGRPADTRSTPTRSDDTTVLVQPSSGDYLDLETTEPGGGSDATVGEDDGLGSPPGTPSGDSSTGSGISGALPTSIGSAGGTLFGQLLPVSSSVAGLLFAIALGLLGSFVITIWLDPPAKLLATLLLVGAIRAGAPAGYSLLAAQATVPLELTAVVLALELLLAGLLLRFAAESAPEERVSRRGTTRAILLTVGPALALVLTDPVHGLVVVDGALGPLGPVVLFVILAVGGAGVGILLRTVMRAKRRSGAPG